jgi:hypothetical protein
MNIAGTNRIIQFIDIKESSGRGQIRSTTEFRAVVNSPDAFVFVHRVIKGSAAIVARKEF